jgi:hypothetical protein
MPKGGMEQRDLSREETDMKLDRNVNGHGKYGLINNRRIAEIEAISDNAKSFAEHAAPCEIDDAIAVLEKYGIIEWGLPNTAGEFFVIKLRDRNAPGALDSYAASAFQYDAEFGREVHELAERSGHRSPFCKEPD